MNWLDFRFCVLSRLVSERERLELTARPMGPAAPDYSRVEFLIMGELGCPIAYVPKWSLRFVKRTHANPRGSSTSIEWLTPNGWVELAPWTAVSTRTEAGAALAHALSLLCHIEMQARPQSD